MNQTFSGQTKCEEPKQSKIHVSVGFIVGNLKNFLSMFNKLSQFSYVNMIF